MLVIQYVQCMVTSHSSQLLQSFHPLLNSMYHFLISLTHTVFLLLYFPHLFIIQSSFTFTSGLKWLPIYLSHSLLCNCLTYILTNYLQCCSSHLLHSIVVLFTFYCLIFFQWCIIIYLNTSTCSCSSLSCFALLHSNLGMLSFADQWYVSVQEHHFSLLQRETEKLRSDIEKMRSELRYGLY